MPRSYRCLARFSLLVHSPSAAGTRHVSSLQVPGALLAAGAFTVRRRDEACLAPTGAWRASRCWCIHRPPQGRGMSRPYRCLARFSLLVHSPSAVGARHASLLQVPGALLAAGAFTVRRRDEACLFPTGAWRASRCWCIHRPPQGRGMSRPCRSHSISVRPIELC